MFMFDIETLGTESTAVILSAAVIHFEVGKSYEYDDLINNACFVKLAVDAQIKQYSRTMDMGTLEWWEGQHTYVKNTSLNRSKDDLFANDAINEIRKYIAKYPEPDQTIWARGSLDQMCFDSLTMAVDNERLFPYNNWRDVRTAIDLLKDTAKSGYCQIEHPTFQKHNVIKHHPVHDCAYDIMMMLYGV